MKAKVLLGILFINLIFISIYLVLKPAPVSAENTQTTKKEMAQPGPAPLVLNSTDQLEVLRQREDKVKEREMELKILEKQVTEKIQKLEAIETSIKNDLASYKVITGERIKQLVKIYSSMKPNAAATLMNNLDTDVAVQVFIGLKGDVAGSILSYMEPVKAAGITQRLVYYRGTTTAQSEAAPTEK